MDHSPSHARTDPRRHSKYHVMKIINMFISRLYLCLIFGLLFVSCEKEGSNDQTLLLPKKDRSFFVLNEGSFGQGNASLCLVDYEDGVDCEVYDRMSDQPLGDVLHSGVLLDDELHLVVNGSGRLVRIQLPELTVSGLIEGLGSPRIMLPISQSKAYIGDLFSDEIHIIDLEDYSRDGAIPFDGWIEEMVLTGDRVWAVNPELFSGPATDGLIMIDPVTDEVTGSFAVGRNPVSIQEDPSGDLWVLCAGSVTDSVPAQLVRVDPVNQMADTVVLLPPAYGGKIRISELGTKLAILMNGILIYDTMTGQLDPMTTLNLSLISPYGLEFDPRNQSDLWITDAINFTSEGKIIRWDIEANELRETIQTGINPNGLIFY